MAGKGTTCKRLSMVVLEQPVETNPLTLRIDKIDGSTIHISICRRTEHHDCSRETAQDGLSKWCLDQEESYGHEPAVIKACANNHLVFRGPTPARVGGMMYDVGGAAPSFLLPALVMADDDLPNGASSRTLSESPGSKEKALKLHAGSRSMPPESPKSVFPRSETDTGRQTGWFGFSDIY
jgi:hypothetical protein